jgi:hypothetical protein
MHRLSNAVQLKGATIFILPKIPRVHEQRLDQDRVWASESLRHASVQAPECDEEDSEPRDSHPETA